ncbi:hypothetical protein [Niveispirillum sp.]|uniref:hypothetical protein n=1 Tax=Niveispirillum sp. TaxID=1917217 RepID=UPI001B477E53|nr:hypothetical protein [Niveispirillum sp.]MBP7334809.1 hypothetical protein [Niveispirillum sp.]
MTFQLRHILAVAGLLALAACGTPPAPVPVATAPVPADPELVFWESVRDSKEPAEYFAYLHAYPAGRFSALARIRIEALTPKPPGKEPPPAPKPKPAPAKPQVPPPSHQQGEPTISEAPAPPVNWAKIDDVSGRANPLLRSQIMDCWDPPPLPGGAGNYRAEVGVYYDPATGLVRGAAFLGGNREMTDSTFARFVNSALAAPMAPACRTLDLRQPGATTETAGLVLLFALDSPP